MTNAVEKLITLKTGEKVNYLEEIPEGFKEIKDTWTNPIGFKWYSNGKSMFSEEYQQVLVKEKLCHGIDCAWCLVDNCELHKNDKKGN